MNQKTVIELPLYQGVFVLHMVDDIEALDKEYKLELRNDAEFDAVTFTAPESNNNWFGFHIAFLTKETSPGIIAHECLHVLNLIFDRVGIRYDQYNDEPAAYLMKWLVNNVHVFFSGSKLKYKD